MATCKKSKHLKLVERDPYLQPYEGALQGRYDYAMNKEKEITGGQPLSEWATGYLYFGLHHTPVGAERYGDLYQGRHEQLAEGRSISSAADRKWHMGSEVAGESDGSWPDVQTARRVERRLRRAYPVLCAPRGAGRANEDLLGSGLE